MLQVITTDIYVPLLDEGTPAWRPVAAVNLGDGVYQIPADARVPDDERWAFGPGERVCCATRVLGRGAPVPVAVAHAPSRA